MNTWFVCDMPLCNIAVCVMLLIQVHSGGIVTKRIKAFSDLTLMAIFASVTSIFYLQYDFGGTTYPYPVVYLLDCAYNFLYAVLSLTFLGYSRVTLGLEKRNILTTVLHILNCALFIVTAVCIETPIFAWENEAGRIENTALNYLWSLPQFLPILIVGFMLARRLVNPQYYAERENIWPLFTFEVFNILAILVLLYDANLNISPMVFCVADVYIYTTMLNEGVLHDELTKLRNRRRLLQDMQQKMERDKNGVWAVFLMDLNDFKSINDTLGHSEGDKALLAAADALRTLCDKTGAAAYRYGGDEFIILRDINVSTEAYIFTQRIQKELGSAGTNAITQYPLSASIGYAIHEPGEQHTIPEMIAEADSMMYEMKLKYKHSKR